MSVSRIYLDHNASAPLKPEARAAMQSAMDVTGNPSSIHHEGRAARALIETAREEVAALVGARPGEVIFTSGATEANNWAFGARNWAGVAAGDAEHASVLAPARRLTCARLNLPCGVDGVHRIEEVPEWALSIDQPSATVMVSLAMANGETGVVQPVADLVAALQGSRVVVHTDAAQAAGRIRLDFKALGVHLMSLSAHKLGGPKGIGALIVRDGLAIDPLMVGGGQERRRRAGTENIISIAGFGAAAAAARRSLEIWDRVGALRDGMEAELRRITPQCVVFGDTAPRLPNTSLIAVPGKAAETSVIKFDLAGVAVSAGAACSSGKVGPSHVLAAMGIGDELARSAVRISLGPETTRTDIAALAAAWASVMRSAAMAA